LVDRLIKLIAGSDASVSRAVPSGLFKHTPYNPNSLWTTSQQKPRPFEVIDSGIAQPLDVPSTMAASQIWHGAQLTLRIGYGPRPHDATTRMKAIQEQRYYIRRCLNDPDSWANTAGFSKVEAFEGDILEEDIEGSDEDGEPTSMLVLEIPVNLTFREDHS
jgi:hypothetical protein